MESFILQFVRLLVGIIFAVLAQYLAIRLFDQFTTKINEVEELKKGNYAVGIVLGSVILSVATIVAGGVERLIAGSAQADFWETLGIGVLNLVVSLILAVAAVFIAVSVFEKIASEIDMQNELKKRNVGVAALLAAVIYATALVIQAGLPHF